MTKQTKKSSAVWGWNIHPGEILREEYMKPLSLSVCALAKELKLTRPPPERHRSRAPYPGFDVLVAALDNMFTTNGIFSQYGGSSWKILCDYTHCGIEQLCRQIGPDGSIQPSYEPVDVQEILRCATSAFALATIPFLQVNEKEDAAKAVSDQYMALYNLTKLRN